MDLLRFEIHAGLNIIVFTGPFNWWDRSEIELAWFHVGSPCTDRLRKSVILQNVKPSLIRSLKIVLPLAFRFKKNSQSNPNLCGLFRGSFWGQITPCLKLVRIMLETCNSVRKFTYICSFRKYTFQFPRLP